MTASYFGNEHHVALQHREVSENTAVSVALDTSDHRVAPVVSDPREAMRPDRCGGGVSLGTIQEMLALTHMERDSPILRNYQLWEKDFHKRFGASSFSAYLEGEHRSLAEVTTSDLEKWALTPVTSGKTKGNLPSARSFQGAKALCAFAGRVGYIDARRAKDIAECPQWQIDASVLRRQLQNPALTRKDQESSIRLYFQSVDKDPKHHLGASAFQAYLERQARSLAEVTTSDLEQWALTLVTTLTGKVTVPTARAFEGAKRLCAVAAELGYIDLQRGGELAECKRPHFTLDSLRQVLQNPALSRKEREHHIFHNYESSEHNRNRLTGATSFRTYLERAEIPLAKVSRSDLNLWALTPLEGSGNLPGLQAFGGAKALCARAAEVGHIDAQRARELATSTRPHVDVHFLRTALQNPSLTRNERDNHIHLNYRNLEKDINRHGGASGIMAYLKGQGRSLSEVTTSDLQGWALTPMAKGQTKGNFPSVSAFEGAKGLCALAGEVGDIDPQTAHDIAQCLRPQADVASLRRLLQSPELTRKERDHHIRLSYQSAEKNADRQAGASRFLAYLESRDMSLAEASKSDLQAWALRPIVKPKSKKIVPSLQAFEGAKALCALATEIGHLDAQRAQAIASCTRPHVDTDSLRIVLQNPALTPKEREYQICLYYQSSEKDPNFLAGANAFWAHLKHAEIPLAEVTKSKLEQWALTTFITPRGTRSVPNPRAFKGAKALCAVAAEVGYIDAQNAKEIAECPRPHFDVDFLRLMLENPVLMGPDKESQICLNYQSTEKNVHRQGGANGFLAYLKKQSSSLAVATKSDLEQWGLTKIAAGHGKGTLPSKQAFEGAKALCALAAQVGYIDARRASELAKCPRPQEGAAAMSMVTYPEAGPQTAESSGAMLERANKRLRSDDLGASTSMSHSFPLPQSDVLFGELALSPPSLLDPDARSPQTGSTRSVIDELENLEDMLGFCGQLY